MVLTTAEARVLGSLMEKETTTPEAYPLSLNALVAACNQKSSRDPVLQLTERDAHAALRSLEEQNLVAIDHGSRVERYENRARTVLHLRRDENALLCLLLLRGPQTPGELRGRSDRLFTFDDVSAVLSALHRMSSVLEGEQKRDSLVAALPRQPGSREQRYTHLLSGIPDIAEPATTSATAPRNTPAQAIEDLQRRVQALEAALLQAGIPLHAAAAQGHPDDATNPSDGVTDLPR